MRLRVFLICVAVLLLAFAGLGWYVLTRPIARAPVGILPPSCNVTTDAGTVELDTTQIANAATIAAVGITRAMPEQAIVIALAAAMQESHLENLSGGDRDSVGLFQQRPSQGWGTPENLADPRYAAGMFYQALTKIKGWQSMRVTEAAQRVQRSAYPEAYEQWATHAAVMTEALVGKAPTALTCERLKAPSTRGAAAVAALGAGLRADWGDVQAVPSAGGLSVTAASAAAGWQYAHWMVANAAGRGISRVHYTDQEWTAQSGQWHKAEAPTGDVVAEVYQA
jgi:hypothetical protein